MRDSTCRVSVVIPAMNEARNLRHVLPLIPSWVDEVILVDGSSTDGTSEVARELWPAIVIVAQDGPGKGSALRSGFSAATGEIIVMLDADGSTDPREIPAFVDALLDGADYVKGSRFMPGGGTEDMQFYRKLGNAAFVGAVRLLFGGAFTDLCYGYSAFWTRVLPHLQLDATGFEIETQMSLRALWTGLSITEVPSFEAARIHGSSNLRTIPDGWRVLKQICGERFQSRIQRGSAAAAGMDAVGIPVGIPVMADPLASSVAQSGRPSLGIDNSLATHLRDGLAASSRRSLTGGDYPRDDRNLVRVPVEIGNVSMADARPTELRTTLIDEG